MSSKNPSNLGSSSLNPFRLSYLCLDIGDKFIGVAIRQKDQFLITPLESIIREGKFQFKKIITLIETYSIDKVIIGYPKYLDGTASIQTKKIKNYYKKFKSLAKVPVVLFDETLSTWEIKQKYPQLKKTTKQKNIDSFCAMEILKNFLEGKTQ